MYPSNNKFALFIYARSVPLINKQRRIKGLMAPPRAAIKHASYASRLEHLTKRHSPGKKVQKKKQTKKKKKMMMKEKKKTTNRACKGRRKREQKENGEERNWPSHKGQRRAQSVFRSTVATPKVYHSRAQSVGCSWDVRTSRRNTMETVGQKRM